MKNKTHWVRKFPKVTFHEAKYVLSSIMYSSNNKSDERITVRSLI